ncbi:MAG: hypothetical protein F6K63_22270 [Moorea sp. SIO1G6]|uniref:Uncharacterized protein n=1 Tax=Moorena producens (strain JHB) TaxID=1454205 RepID=A0A9Q9UWA6_MOOP1|nr:MULTISPECIES: hypothetical protein [Moorena]NET66965.1 hypothetical protein [Moorena sp. SIO1G6]WAN69646.1 hypothetical protein BJP36_36770 [Moorena producens JHB]
MAKNLTTLAKRPRVRVQLSTVQPTLHRTPKANNRLTLAFGHGCAFNP